MVYAILVCLLLLVIFIQDVLYKQVLVIIFPILLVLWLFYYDQQTTFIDILFQAFFNCILVSFCLLCIKLYTKIRKIGFLNVSFGMGDILILYVLAACLPVHSFIYVWLTATMVSLIIQSIRKEEKIPYAGYISLVSATALVIDLIRGNTFLYA